MVTINKLYNKFQLEILIKQNFNGNNLNKLAGYQARERELF